MLPHSWKSEVQKAIEETTAADRDQRKAEQNEAGANITAAINSLRDAQTAQTNSEDTNEKKNRGINKATLVLVAFTVLFTALSWLTFRAQLKEMQAEQRPWVYETNIEPAGHIILAKEQYAIPLKFSIKNTGHLPAFFVVPKTSATILKVGMSTKNVRNDICDEYRKTSLANGGETVFADQVITHGGFTSDDYPTVLKQDWDLMASDRMIVMYGCIDYQFADQPGHHQSRFSFAVGERKDQGILARMGKLPDDPTTVDIRLLAVTIDDGTPAD